MHWNEGALASASAAAGAESCGGDASGDASTGGLPGAWSRSTVGKTNWHASTAEPTSAARLTQRAAVLDCLFKASSLPRATR